VFLIFNTLPTAFVVGRVSIECVWEPHNRYEVLTPVMERTHAVDIAITFLLRLLSLFLVVQVIWRDINSVLG